MVWKISDTLPSFTNRLSGSAGIFNQNEHILHAILTGLHLFLFLLTNRYRYPNMAVVVYMGINRKAGFNIDHPAFPAFGRVAKNRQFIL